MDRWRNLMLTAEEEDIFVVADSVVKRGRVEMKSCLLGKLMLRRSYDKGAFMAMVKAVWRMERKLEITEVARDIFLLSFRNEGDRDLVLEGQLKKVENNDNLDFDDFCYTNFWVQAHNLPVDSRFPEVGELIGDVAGNLIKVHTNKNGRCIGRYLRIRSKIDITAGSWLRIYNSRNCGTSTTGAAKLGMLLIIVLLPSSGLWRLSECGQVC